MIYELLGTGAENAMTAKELSALLKTDTRTIQERIQIERRQGMPICASTDTTHPGFFIPETRNELEDYCGRLKHRAIEIFTTRKYLMQAAETLPEKEDE